MNIQTMSIDDELYPPLLRQIKDPPQRLYYAGDPSLCSGCCLSVVGARKCSSYGRWAAEQIASRAAFCGAVVVSGLAYGIDAAAHRGALKADGGTIAVMGTGVDVCYPRNNRALWEEIGEKGLILSEYPPGTEGYKSNFPRRNRIISGLSPLTVVVEAGLNSGSLITAGLAAEQGREVFAVPGNINSALSLGCNKLIQDGAAALAVPDDVLGPLGLSPRFSKETEMALGKDEKQLLRILARSGECSLAKLAEESGRPVGETGALVSILEIKGLVQSSFGKIFLAQ